MVDRDKKMVKDMIDRNLADAGWETDGSFSEHLSIGNSGELCLLVHRSTWDIKAPTYELYDMDKHLSYWVHEIPTPERAAALLEEHGEPAEEE
jgi:hypothetical protein